ncbi:MAG: hypothetical protein CSB21_03300 [Deltaproteobacteria bacterium]|nr:MAG: hypothetical protein CSB21_03300 [Deltaproteobacteria bacterium]
MNIIDQVTSQEEKYRKAAQTLLDIIWVIDAKTFNFLYISEESYFSIGYSPNELIGKNIQTILTEKSLIKLRGLFQKEKNNLLEKKLKNIKTEIEAIKKDKTKIWVEIAAKILEDSDGTLKIVGVSKDINIRKKAESDKKELLEELRNAIQEKDKLASHIKKLENMLPICSGCRRIRNEKDNTWWPFEQYIEEKSKSKFTHTICPDCKNIFYPRNKS